MPIDSNRTVRELAVEIPGATREQVASALAETAQAADATVPDAWEGEPLSALIEHIEKKHHAYTREELDRLAPLSVKVATVHGDKHPELEAVRQIVAALDTDLRPHLLKEERILFPFIIELEVATRTGRARPLSPFGTIRNPVRMMLAEHDTVGALLRELRAVTRDYELKEDACMSYRTLYAALQDMAKDLHQHIHLESNVLFPRAVVLES